MKKRLYLHGALSAYGGPYSFDMASPAEMVQALASQHKCFERHIAKGKFHLMAGPLSRKRLLSGQAVFAPCLAPSYHLYPALSGASKGRGKMVLGLTLLGLSFVPGVSTGFSQVGAAASGSGSFGQSFATIGTNMLARTGHYLMAQGALQAISPPQFSQTDTTSSQLSASANASNEGGSIPLVYGEVRLSDPLFIETGLHIETKSL